MNLTDLRNRPPKRDKARASEPPSVEPDDLIPSPHLGVEDLESWLGEFSRLHQICVQVLDGSGKPIVEPQQEPVFCTVAKSSRPGGCPHDCGRSLQGEPRSSEPQMFQCPYHLSSISWVVRPSPGVAWTVIIGRTLATQDQMSKCLETIREAEEFGDEALAALGSIPWQAEPQLVAACRFLESTMRLIFRPVWNQDKDKDLSKSRRNSHRD